MNPLAFKALRLTDQSTFTSPSFAHTWRDALTEMHTCIWCGSDEPALDCNCGLYASTKLSTIKWYTQGWTVVLLVEACGPTIFGTEGFRSQQQYVVGVVNWHPNAKALGNSPAIDLSAHQLILLQALDFFGRDKLIPVEVAKEMITETWQAHPFTKTLLEEVSATL